jgi:hypothetical protein
MEARRRSAIHLVIPLRLGDTLMNARIVTPKRFAVALTFACLLQAYSTALAQSGTQSDSLSLKITDPSGADVVAPLPPITLPETGVIEPITVTIPARNIVFTHTAAGNDVSDYLHIDSFSVNIYSDDETPLTLRGGPTVIIPATANEAFLPVNIFAHSDGDSTTSGQNSDHVKIFAGDYGQAGQLPVFFQQILEPPEGTTEPSIAFLTGPLPT